VETQIDAILISFLAEMALKRLFARVRAKVPLEMVRLGVPAPADRTFERLLARMGTNVDHQALLVGERLAARGTDMRPIVAVRATVLRQHRLRQEVGTALADVRTVPRVKTDMLSQLCLLAERALAHSARERTNAEMAQLVLVQLYFLNE